MNGILFSRSSLLAASNGESALIRNENTHGRKGTIMQTPIMVRP